MEREAETALIGRTIAGKFTIESFIGAGAMGAVYKARQVALEKTVAIKVMHLEHANDATFSARFQREAKAASRLDHPNSMRVIDFGEDPDGLLYIAMEFLDGRDLFRVIQQDWPLASERIVELLSQTLAALAVAHDMGVVHRDLKPENIMVLSRDDDDGETRDVVKVCDFGIAKITEPETKEPRGGPGRKLTTQGIVVGTPEYMSPEQGKGELLDARSDLYSVGVILYQLLTGRVPFEAETAIGVVLKHVTEEPTPPSELSPAALPRLEAVCLKAMKKKPDDRYQTARAMRSDLRAAIGATGPHSSPAPMDAPALSDSGRLAVPAPVLKITPSKVTPTGTVALSEPKPRRARAPLVLAAVGALAVGAAGTVGVLRWRAGAGASSPSTTASAAPPRLASPVPPAASATPSASAPPATAPATATATAPPATTSAEPAPSHEAAMRVPDSDAPAPAPADADRNGEE